MGNINFYLYIVMKLSFYGIIFIYSCKLEEKDGEMEKINGTSSGVFQNLTKLFSSHLDNVTDSNAGNFTCLVKNQSGENGSKTIEIEIKGNNKILNGILCWLTIL